MLLFIITVFSCFIARLVDWQVINSEYYKERANSSNIYFVKTDPVRGEIFDCDGNRFATNVEGYKVVLDRLLIKKEEENNIILSIIKILEKFNCSWIDVMPIKLKNNEFYFENDKQSQIKSLKAMLKLSEDSAANDCMNEMINRYNLSEFSKQDQRAICSVRSNIDKNGGYVARYIPYVLSENINKDAAMTICEKSSVLKGVRVQTLLVRKYEDNCPAPHIVGYTGFMSSEEYEKKKDSYPMDAVIGKIGIEGVFEEFLRGFGGKRMVQMSRDGQILNISEKEPARPGNNVHLTISSKLQEAANKSLANNIQRMHNSGVSDCMSGSAVVLNVKDFSVLAAATYPSYDLTKFMEDKAYRAELVKDTKKPMLNRAFLGAYTPGSVYKPLIASTALHNGKISASETISCSGAFTHYVGYRLKCMHVHGALSVVKALAKSCNVFFAELGRRLGIDLIAKYAKLFGLGVKTGVELSESSGILAGPEHSEKVGGKWYESGSSQAAIGQSDNMFTPLQLATYVATIANGGNRYKTHLMKKVTDYTNTEIVKENKPELIEKIDISEENLNIVKQGMREVVLSGTARDFAGYKVAVAGKTGTAQNNGSDHVLFICFAPFDDPQIAVAVVIEHGKSGSASKGVARDILDAYFQ